ncbi:MAG: cyclic nucleotide-binding domain-containing protein [Rhodospirillales bacterium]
MALEHSFGNLTDDERTALTQVAVGHAFESGDIVINQGDAVDNLMVVAKGMLRVTHVFEGGKLSEFVGPLGPGDVVGEMSFVDGKGASATLIADGDTEVLIIPRNAIEALMEDSPSFAGRLFKDLFLHLSRRLRATNLRADPGLRTGG